MKDTFPGEVILPVRPSVFYQPGLRKRPMKNVQDASLVYFQALMRKKKERSGGGRAAGDTDGGFTDITCFRMIWAHSLPDWTATAGHVTRKEDKQESLNFGVSLRETSYDLQPPLAHTVRHSRCMCANVGQQRRHAAEGVRNNNANAVFTRL